MDVCRGIRISLWLGLNFADLNSHAVLFSRRSKTPASRREEFDRLIRIGTTIAP